MWPFRRWSCNVIWWLLNSTRWLRFMPGIINYRPLHLSRLLVNANIHWFFFSWDQEQHHSLTFHQQFSQQWKGRVGATSSWAHYAQTDFGQTEGGKKIKQKKHQKQGNMKNILLPGQPNNKKALRSNLWFGNNYSGNFFPNCWKAVVTEQSLWLLRRRRTAGSSKDSEQENVMFNLR